LEEQRRILEIEEKNRQLVIEAAYRADQQLAEHQKGSKGAKKGRKIKEDDFLDNEEQEMGELEHFKYDEQGLIHTPSDDHDYDFAAAEQDEDEMSLGNVDEMQSNVAASIEPVSAAVVPVEKPKKDKKHKKDKDKKKKDKDKKDKKDKKHKHKLHRNSEVVKEEDLPLDLSAPVGSPAPKKEDEDVVGKKRRMKRNVVDDDDEEESGEAKRQKTE